MSERNIFQRMAAITADLQTVAKNLDVSTGKGKGYKAVSERDIIDAVKPAEAAHGVYSYPCDRKVLESQTLESSTDYGIKTTFMTRIQTTYRFVNVDNPDDFIEMVTFAEGIDAQDKGSGKAMTYSDKYALMKAYKISTGDDPDQTASEETRYTQKRSGNKSGDRWSVTPPDISEVDDDVLPSCSRCGATISEREHDYSARLWGKPLCRSCQKDVPRK